MKRRPTQLVAIRIVREHLAEMGGAHLGWSYDADYRRLAKRIERAILDDRKRERERAQP